MDAAEEVKSHLDIADIVGEYLPLKPAGSGSFKACCPFHQEKTPSFFVNRQRQNWHCFGCNKGGDVISFVMEIEGMEFRDALEHLAQKSGVALPAFDTQAAGLKKRLHEINDLAARFFRAQLLQSSQAERARAYAASRGIDELTGDLFKIGYAPAAWDALVTALKGKGVTDDELVSAGLALRRQDGSGVIDRFRDRLMFTIQDIHGHVVGFTGRLMNPEAKEAKYVNTPETAVYKKSLVLYGLDKAKGDIKSKNLCIVVEGNMDALSSHRVGITNVVASSGTALTTEQLKLIQRFTKNIAIAFDGDSAGVHATLRGLDLARAQDFDIRIITLPPEAGKDPDEAISKDPALWERAILESVGIMDWIFRASFKGKDVLDPKQKTEIAASVLPEIKRIADPIIRDHWIKKLAEALQTSEQTLIDALNRTKSLHPAAQTAPAFRRDAGTDASKQGTERMNNEENRRRDLAERLCAIGIRHPNFFTTVPEELALSFPEPMADLYRHVRAVYHSDKSQEAGQPADHLQSPDQNLQRFMDYLAIRMDRDHSNQTADALASEFTTYLAAYRSLITDIQRKRLEEDMRAAELAGDRQKIQELTQRFKTLH